jgi:CHAT domain-containing protein
VRAAELDPGRAALIGARRARTSEIQRALRPSELLLQYLTAGQSLLVFVLTTDTIHVHELDVPERDLTGRVRLARDLLNRRDVDAAVLNDVLAGLHELLLQPVLASGQLNRADHLFIVPHGALTYLPFAALKSGTTDRYLVEDHALSHLPAAGALPLLREAKRTVQNGNALRRATVFAPLPDELPATRDEAKAVDRAVPRARDYVGRRATEARLRKALEEPRIVHVATHGILNVRSPVFSRLELAGTRSSNPQDDGRLEVHEILGLSVASPLVYLSGCETGLGAAWSTDFARGEDYATLAQAFLFTGARNVIATLWRIDDAGAAAFAERFYVALGNTGPAEALAAAQRTMMADEVFGSPYYWAGYTISGP